MKLIIGNQNYSSWSLRPWLLLTHFDINFDLHGITLFSEDMLEQMSPFCPNNKVPVLIDQREKIWDSLAICEYLNEQHIDNKAWPFDPLDRAKARSICAEMHASFFSLREEMPMNCRRVPSKILLSKACQNDIDRVIDIWQSCLIKNQHGFLFDDFSIADAFYMPIISPFNSYQIQVPARVKSYMTKMLDLPSYKKWLDGAKQEKEVIECEEV